MNTYTLHVKSEIVVFVDGARANTTLQLGVRDVVDPRMGDLPWARHFVLAVLEIGQGWESGLLEVITLKLSRF